MKTYIVFWVNGGRIGSVPLTERNLVEAKQKLHLSLIQRDITGTEHYSVLGIRCFHVRRRSRPNDGRESTSAVGRTTYGGGPRL